MGKIVLPKQKYSRILGKDAAEYLAEDIRDGWIVLRHSVISSKAQRRLLYGKWCLIRSESGNHVYRRLRFSPNIKESEVAIDYGAWLQLSDWSEEVPGELVLELSEIAPIDYICLPVWHPDPGIRISSWIAYIALLLTILQWIAC